METSFEQGSSEPLTKREARAFKKRWAVANAAKRQDLATTPVAQKFRQVEALIVSARQLGWTEAPTEDEGGVWERWAECAELLGPNIHVQSDYGDEADGFTPWELFDQDAARQALDLAEEAAEVARQLVPRS